MTSASFKGTIDAPESSSNKNKKILLTSHDYCSSESVAEQDFQVFASSINSADRLDELEKAGEIEDEVKFGGDSDIRRKSSSLHRMRPSRTFVIEEIDDNIVKSVIIEEDKNHGDEPIFEKSAASTGFAGIPFE